MGEGWMMASVEHWGRARAIGGVKEEAGDLDATRLRASLADPAVFSVVFDDYFDVVYRYAARRVGPMVAEDITAETFTVAFDQRDRFDPARGRCSSWLLGIATNLIRRHYRSETRRLAAVARLRAQPSAASTAPSAEGPELHGYALDRISSGLAVLSASQRDLISLVDGAGLTYREAATALGLPLGTVQSRLSRARAILRDHVGIDPALNVRSEETDQGGRR
jgi:RNA polymerase sigma factor (sigma-70 family)